MKDEQQQLCDRIAWPSLIASFPAHSFADSGVNALFIVYYVETVLCNRANRTAEYSCIYSVIVYYVELFSAIGQDQIAMQRRGKTARIAPEQAFARALREIRKRRGISQENLGFESGYHRTYISLLERGKMNPSLRTMLSIASALGVSTAELVGSVERLLGAAWRRERAE